MTKCWPYPKLKGMIVARSAQAVPGGVPCNVTDAQCMAAQRGAAVPTLHVPDLGSGVGAG